VPCSTHTTVLAEYDAFPHAHAVSFEILRAYTCFSPLLNLVIMLSFIGITQRGLWVMAGRDGWNVTIVVVVP
jgi:hypothetical protein